MFPYFDAAGNENLHDYNDEREQDFAVNHFQYEDDYPYGDTRFSSELEKLPHHRQDLMPRNIHGNSYLDHHRSSGQTITPRYHSHDNHLTPYVPLGKSIANGFNNYFNFSGRSTRAEFWNWSMFSFAILFLGAAVSPAIPFLWFLTLGIPTLSVGVRRLHDVGLPGPAILMNLFPLGPIAFLAVASQRSTNATNMWGAPLGLESKAHYSPNDYQAQQFTPQRIDARMPTVSQQRQLPSGASRNPNITSRELTQAINPPRETLTPAQQKAKRESEEWKNAFNNTHKEIYETRQNAKVSMPDVYKNHYFTDQETVDLEAGNVCEVILTDFMGEMYSARLKWNGKEFNETNIQAL